MFDFFRSLQQDAIGVDISTFTCFPILFARSHALTCCILALMFYDMFSRDPTYSIHVFCISVDSSVQRLSGSLILLFVVGLLSNFKSVVLVFYKHNIFPIFFYLIFKLSTVSKDCFKSIKISKGVVNSIIKFPVYVVYSISCCGQCATIFRNFFKDLVTAFYDWKLTFRFFQQHIDSKVSCLRKTIWRRAVTCHIRSLEKRHIWQ